MAAEMVLAVAAKVKSYRERLTSVVIAERP
jgi:hypothetical protein